MSALKRIREYGDLKGIVEHLREEHVLYLVWCHLVHDENRQAEKEDAAPR